MINADTTFLAVYDLDTEYFNIPKNIILNFSILKLKPSEFSFYCLINCLESVGAEIPNQKELGAMLNFSERQIKVIISNLKSKDMLKVSKKKSYNKYDFSGLLSKAKE